MAGRSVSVVALGLALAAGRPVFAAAYARDCRVSAGKVTGCFGGRLYGELPVAYNPSTSLYEKDCRVSAGKVTGCFGGRLYGELPVAYNPH